MANQIAVSRRCPRCKTVGKMYKSHARNKIEKMMGAVTSLIVKYRCHQCNWRGYMFKAFKNQSRPMHWLTIFAFIGAVVIGIYMLPKILLKFVAAFAR